MTGGRRRRPGPLSAVAVVAVVAFGLVLAAAFAQPGDPGWRVARVLYPDYARVVEQADAAVRAHTAAKDAATEARAAIRAGEGERAARALVRLQAQLPLIDGAEQAAGRRLHALLSADLRAAQTTTGVQR